MTGLLLIRHGPTAWNRAGRIQGRSDQPLDPEGRSEVATWRLPALCQDSHWVTSPLERARETAALLGHGDAATASELIETDWGDWEGLSLADLRCRQGEEMTRLESRGLDFRPPGGESPRDLQRRLGPWLTRTAAEPRSTVAVCHKGVVRAIYALASGWDMVGPPPVKLVSSRAQAFELDSRGRPSVARLNIPLLP